MGEHDLEYIDIEYILDETNIVECPVCGGWSIPLGILGKLLHYICQDCGIEFNTEIK